MYDLMIYEIGKNLNVNTIIKQGQLKELLVYRFTSVFGRKTFMLAKLSIRLSNQIIYLTNHSFQLC